MNMTILPGLFHSIVVLALLCLSGVYLQDVKPPIDPSIYANVNCTEKGTGAYPSLKCQIWVECRGDTAIPYRCIPLYVFHDDSESCVPQANVGVASLCDTDGWRIDFKPTTPAPLFVPCPQPNGFFPVYGSCKKFYQCFQGIHTIGECPPRRFYNGRNCEGQECNPYVTTTVMTTTNTGPTQTTTPDRLNLCLAKDGSTYKDDVYCYLYKECLNRQFIDRECTPRSLLVYNPAIGKCDFKVNLPYNHICRWADNYTAEGVTSPTIPPSTTPTTTTETTTIETTTEATTVTTEEATTTSATEDKQTKKASVTKQPPRRIPGVKRKGADGTGSGSRGLYCSIPVITVALVFVLNMF